MDAFNTMKNVFKYILHCSANISIVRVIVLVLFICLNWKFCRLNMKLFIIRILVTRNTYLQLPEAMIPILFIKSNLSNRYKSKSSSIWVGAKSKYFDNKLNFIFFYRELRLLCWALFRNWVARIVNVWNWITELICLLWICNFFMEFFIFNSFVADFNTSSVFYRL